LSEIVEQAAANPEKSARGPDGRQRNAMSVDVEEYFQVSAFAGTTRPAEWDSHESRVEQNIDAILAIFAEHGARATFFTLGWIAERHPEMIRRIVAGGHEIASHGYQHVQVFDQSPDQFRTDVRRTRAMLQEISGTAVRGYRAASFSIDARTLWAFEILAEEGYEYSSSIYPIRHDLYGMPDAPRFAFRPDGAKGLIEVPVTTVRVFGHNMPCGGGGYFRLLPEVYSRWAMRRVNRNDRRPCIFYFHPWEIDPNQPRMPGLPLKSRFRHYTNLGRMEGRLHRVLRDFAWDRMDRVFLGDGVEI